MKNKLILFAGLLLLTQSKAISQTSIVPRWQPENTLHYVIKDRQTTKIDHPNDTVGFGLSQTLELDTRWSAGEPQTDGTIKTFGKTQTIETYDASLIKIR